MLADDSIRESIVAVVDSAPPLTSGQVALLRGAGIPMVSVDGRLAA